MYILISQDAMFLFDQLLQTFLFSLVINFHSSTTNILSWWLNCGWTANTRLGLIILFFHYYEKKSAFAPASVLMQEFLLRQALAKMQTFHDISASRKTMAEYLPKYRTCSVTIFLGKIEWPIDSWKTCNCACSIITQVTG